MNDDLKQSILENPFIERLRNGLIVDHAAFGSLCQSLRDLEQAWRGVSIIDKALAQELYVLAPVTNNMAASMAKSQPERAREVAEMAIELDALVLNCLDS